MQFTGADQNKAGVSGTREPKIPIQKTQSFKGEKKRGEQNWFQKQFARKRSGDYDSREMEHAAAVAAATFAITLQDISETKSDTAEASLTRTRSKVDGTKSPVSLLSSASKRFSGSFRSKDDQDYKISKSSVSEGKKPEKAITPAPSMKRVPTFTDKKTDTSAPKVPPPPPPPIRQTSRKPETVGPTTTETQRKAIEWERTELEKIRQRYEKLKETINSWENKRRVKARRKLDKKESELEERRLKALKDFQNNMKYIDRIAEGARGKAEENRKKEELKAREKADVIRKTGKLPGICFCF